MSKLIPGNQRHLTLDDRLYIERSSAKGSLKCILTLYFPDTELLLANLMNRCTPGAARIVFEQMQKALGGAYKFISMFPLILTD